MVVDISGVGYFMPVYGFLFVFLVVYALLLKTKLLGGVMWVDLIISVIIAAIFSTFTAGQDYIQTVVPWFAVLMIVIFLILLIAGFGGKLDAFLTPQFLWIFVVILILIFLVAAVRVFPSFLGPIWNGIVNFAETQAKIFGAIVLIIIASVVAYLVVKK